MTERGLPGVDSAQACPFVAFEDDREARASTPDHRHRCYAEIVPSPRAAAHQEAYCLSSAFPVCPTFQDWARREAARTRAGNEGRAAPPAARDTSPRIATIESMADEGEDDDASGTGDRDDSPPPRHAPLDAPPPVRRNPPRDWAAPPPWAPGGAGPTSRRAGGDPSTPAFLAGREEEGRGLAGSAADRLASGSGGRAAEAAGAGYEPAAPPDEELAGLVGGRRLVDLPRHDEPGRYDELTHDRGGHRPTVSSTRSSRRERERERERDAIIGPSWERARRYEAFPTIRARGGLPEIPRLAVLAGALVIAAVALFFLPALLGIGGKDGGGTSTASPGASQAAGETSPSAELTTPPPPTSQVYVVEAGDTMSKIASRFGLTLDELCNANKENIPDCDKIAIGDEVVIPTKAPEEFTEPSASPS
jgi:hypothetical protein